MNKEVSNTDNKSIALPSFESPYIDEIFDTSSDHSEIEKTMRDLGLSFDFPSLSVARMLIVFKNKYHMSIIRGELSHGGDRGFFEIAVYHPIVGMTGVYFKGDFNDEPVLGYLTADDVNFYIDKIGKLPMPENISIETKLVGND